MVQHIVELAVSSRIEQRNNITLNPGTYSAQQGSLKRHINKEK